MTIVLSSLEISVTVRWREWKEDRVGFCIAVDLQPLFIDRPYAFVNHPHLLFGEMNPAL